MEKLRALREFARKHCTVLLIAHNRKAEGSNGDEISGSNAFTSSIDGWLSCSKKENQPNGDVRLTLNREGRGDLRGELTIEMNTDTLHFTALSEQQLAEAKRQAQENASGEVKKDNRQTVLELMVSTNDKATAPWIAKELNLSDRSAQTLLQQMAKDGQIEDSQERVGSTGRTIVYRITEQGQCEIRKGAAHAREKDTSAASFWGKDPFRNDVNPFAPTDEEEADEEEYNVIDGEEAE